MRFKESKLYKVVGAFFALLNVMLFVSSVALIAG
jgi:hypothetical protein